MKLWVREARLYEPVGYKNVECGTCERRCVIREGELGFCKTRKNTDGKLYTIVYGDISSISVNPVEKKPLFHFWPGSEALTVGTWSCNFTCPWCLGPQTEIFTAERETITMENLEKCWEQQEVLTCHWENGELTSTPLIRYFRINPHSNDLNVYKLLTKETHRAIVATGDHPFYTDKGVKPLYSMKIGDRVAVYPVIGLKRHSSRDGIIIKNVDVKKALRGTGLNVRKRIDELSSLGLLPLRFNDRLLPIIARLLGHIFGDGYLTISHGRRTKVAVGFTGQPDDLECIRRDLALLGFRASPLITREKVSYVQRYGSRHKINGMSTWMCSHSSTLWTLMRALGAPSGDKSIQAHALPRWLFEASRTVKREFLAAYFGSELTRPTVDRSRKNFYQPRLSLSKRTDLMDCATRFVNDLAKMIREFNVSITATRIIRGAKRKDGTKTAYVYALFSNELESLLILYGTIGYRYSKERDTIARHAYAYLAMKKQVVKTWRSLFKRTLDLARQGYRPIDIYKILGRKVRYGTILWWLRKEHDSKKLKYPKEFPTFDVWKEHATENLGGSGLVWETVERIEKVDVDDVRDLTTALPTHNFFANGFLVSNCQNWTLSKTPPNPAKVGYMSPDKFVSVALRKGCEGTSISFNEPTLLLEYSLDLFPLAHSKGLYNTYVSNGYMTLDALKMLAEKRMDAIKFDVKGDEKAVRRHCGANVNVVWRNAREAKRLGMHVEIVNLVIPKVNDKDDTFREMAARTKEIGNDTPLHFTQFYPAYKSIEVGLVNPTPTDTLERARDIAMDEGLRYVYVGNVPGHPYENTYCPNCGQMLIKRWAFSVLECKITKDRKCPSCGNRIPIVGKYKITESR